MLDDPEGNTIMANAEIYGTRPNSSGWSRATDHFPYETLLGNSEEKSSKAVSGGRLVPDSERAARS
ncbi:MAG: hypothetical protein ACRDKW_17195 [Actinomycetota bacterium]